MNGGQFCAYGRGAWYPVPGGRSCRLPLHRPRSRNDPDQKVGESPSTRRLGPRLAPSGLARATLARQGLRGVRDYRDSALVTLRLDAPTTSTPFRLPLPLPTNTGVSVAVAVTADLADDADDAADPRVSDTQRAQRLLRD